MAPCDMKTEGEFKCLSIHIFYDQKRFTTNKSVDRDFMGRLQPPAPLLSSSSSKKFNLLAGGNEKIKQNKIK